MSSFSFTSPGTYTWTCPPDVYEVTVTVIGGGGGGAGFPNNGDVAQYTCGGGGGGGYGIGRYPVFPYNTYTVIVGYPGARGGCNTLSWYDLTVNGNGLLSGGNGGTSSFGSFLTCTGGYGGQTYCSTTSTTGAAGGTAIGANIFSYDGGYGGGIIINSNCTISPVTTGGISTGGGGLCGSNGGSFNIISTTTSIYQGATTSLAGITTGGGGMYPKAIGIHSTSLHTGGACGINMPCDQGRDSNLTEYVATLFNGYKIDTQPIDGDCKTQGNQTLNMGGNPNIVYRSAVMPPHLNDIFKLFKIVAGNSNSFVPYTSLSLGCNTLPNITGGTASIPNYTRSQGSLLIGGSSGGEARGAVSSVNFDTTRAGFGCGGGGCMPYSNLTKIGCLGGSGLVYLEW